MDKSETVQKAIKFATQLLTKREYSEHEIKRKLTQKKIDQASIRIAIDHLLAVDVISDKRFVQIYIKTNIAKFGDKKIVYNLSQHNISPSLIDVVMLEDGVDDEITRAKNIMDKRFPQGSENSDQTIYSFFNYRGFSSDTIYALLKRYRSNADLD